MSLDFLETARRPDRYHRGGREIAAAVWASGRDLDPIRKYGCVRLGMTLLDGCSCKRDPLLAFMGCCLGTSADNISGSERTLLSSFWIDHTSREIEVDINNFLPLDTHHSSGSISVAEDVKVAIQNVNKHSFVNQAAIAWNEMRQEWLGDGSQRSQRTIREPSISWCLTYDDLLSTNQRFPEPIPLPIGLEMDKFNISINDMMIPSGICRLLFPISLVNYCQWMREWDWDHSRQAEAGRQQAAGCRLQAALNKDLLYCKDKEKDFFLGGV
ncbi:hypothetical protein Cni_G22068 [Canna indica]|uniref:Uncharacterized protein n=1 Tax=Canna indica TaxID=4628 RepID=A0AAQ3KR84_9LILI|nr:hypothetical protein Cni_G22068 [Canna indica]